MADNSGSGNFDSFRECLSGPLIEKSAIKPKRPNKRRTAQGHRNTSKVVKGPVGHANEEQNTAEDMAEFIDYIATEIYSSFPSELRTLSYSAIQNSKQLASAYRDPLSATTSEALLASVPPSVNDSLEAYSFLPSTTDLPHLLIPVIEDYISAVTAPPPVWSQTRTSACEICERSWIPLSYHHLIPRQTHAKAVKRGWHEEWMLNSVAWLCRACHGFVHRIASNEELARDWYTVERLTDREDVQTWAKWVGKVRWKAR